MTSLNKKKFNNIFNFLFSSCIAFGLLFTTACSGKQDSEESSSDYDTETEMSTDEVAEVEIAEPVEPTEPVEPVAEVEGEGADLEDTYVDAGGHTVYNRVETDPVFAGGDEALYKYLSENIEYPAEARRAGAEGPVEVSFVVSSNGSIRDVELLHGHEDASLNEEATRVVSRMPAWEPGTVNGKAVDTKFSLPIDFKLN